MGFDYELKRSRRAKNMRLTVYQTSKVRLTLPYFFDIARGEDFLKKHSAWIEKKLKKINKIAASGLVLPKPGRRDYLKHKAQALKLARQQSSSFNEYYKFRIGRISIKNQRTRWGSCSKIGNLNFNYRIIFLPPELADYIIVHELCHLQELNHSARFWGLVSQTIPDWRKKRKKLRNTR
jgi:hypothetical protein